MKKVFVLLICLAVLFTISQGTVRAKEEKSGMSYNDSIELQTQIQRAHTLFLTNADSALKIFQAMAIKGQNDGNPKIISKANSGMATCYFRLGEYSVAYHLLFDNVKYLSSLSAAEEIGTYRLLMCASYGIGKKEEAIKYGRKALAINNELRKTESLAENNYRLTSILGIMSGIYGSLKKVDSARYYLDEYIKVIDTTNPKHKLPYIQIFEYEGVYYSDKGDTKKGLQYFQKAMSLYKEAFPKINFTERLLLLIFVMYVDNHEYSKARTYIKEIMTLKEMESLDVRIEVFPKIASVDSAEGNFKGAYSLLTKTLELKDSLKDQEMQSRYNYYNSMIGLHEANEQIVIKENAVRNTRYLVILIVIFAVLILVFLLMYFRNRKQRMIIKHHMELKEIGNDLHDEINPILGYARMILSRVVAEDSSDKLLLQKSNKALEETMDNLRMLTRQINMSDLNSEKYKEGLEEMIAKLCEAYGFNATTEFTFNEKSISDILRRNLFLMLQELTHNSMKYSNGTKLYVQIKAEHDELKVCYADNGEGIDNKNASFESTLPKIFRRVSSMHGHAEFSTMPGYPGVCILMTIPLKK